MNIKKDFSSVKAILFDFDGTLVDTMEGYADIAGEIVSSFSAEYTFEQARARYLETSGIPFFQQLEILLPGNSENARLADKFEERKQEGLYRTVFPDEVRETIEELRRRGYLAGISSNNFQHMVDRFLETNHLVFDVVLGFQPGFAKGKDHFERFLNDFGFSRDELLFVGDSLKDAEKALENGITFAGIEGTFSRGEFLELDPGIVTINSIKELLSLCV